MYASICAFTRAAYVECRQSCGRENPESVTRCVLCIQLALTGIHLRPERRLRTQSAEKNASLICRLHSTMSFTSHRLPACQSEATSLHTDAAQPACSTHTHTDRHTGCMSTPPTQPPLRTLVVSRACCILHPFLSLHTACSCIRHPWLQAAYSCGIIIIIDYYMGPHLVRAQSAHGARTHTHTRVHSCHHTHTHTHTQREGGERRRERERERVQIHHYWSWIGKTTDQYAEKIWVFSFDLKEESENECLTEKGSEIQITGPT